MKKKILLLSVVSVSLSACVESGSYLGGVVKVETGQSSSQMVSQKVSTEHDVISWEDLMLEELRAKKVQDTTPYAEDYLKILSGQEYRNIKTNEFEFRKGLNRAKSELFERMNSTKLKSVYQATFASHFGEYDFQKQSFPIDYPEVISGRYTGWVDENYLTNLPYDIQIHINNHEALPDFKIPESDASRFLSNRDGSRGLYVRYILSSLRYKSHGVFTADVSQIQLIDKTLNIINRDHREEFEAFAKINIK